MKSTHTFTLVFPVDVAPGFRITQTCTGKMTVRGNDMAEAMRTLAKHYGTSVERCTKITIEPLPTRPWWKFW